LVLDCAQAILENRIFHLRLKVAQEDISVVVVHERGLSAAEACVAFDGGGWDSGPTNTTPPQVEAP